MFREDYILELVKLDMAHTEAFIRKWCANKSDSQIQEAIDILRSPKPLRTWGTFYTV